MGMRQLLEIWTMLTYPVQIVNPKGEMKGSAITGPVGKEAAELWPVRLPPIYQRLKYPSNLANNTL